MLEKILTATIKAGEKIIEVYESNDIGVETKEDDSPVTIADKLANEILVDCLSSLNAGPILSEEGKNVAWEVRRGWQQYWLVDPLDGTKEFLKKNGEFTVNVALIRGGKPILGVVYAPVKRLWYVGEVGKGAFKKIGNGEFEAIKPAGSPLEHDKIRVVGSRSHASESFTKLVARINNVELVSMGSSLKLCMVADGSADLYPRLGPTSEWDTAAAQAVVDAAGGLVLNWEDRNPLMYNSKESLLNPHFVVCSGYDVLSYIS